MTEMIVEKPDCEVSIVILEMLMIATVVSGVGTECLNDCFNLILEMLMIATDP